MRRTPVVVALLVPMSSAAFISACSEGGERIEDQVVEAGCGLCQLEMEGRSDCYWAVRIDGRELMARGDALPREGAHDSHRPEGMCTMTRHAIVSGTVYETYFDVTSFELQPVAPGTVAAPHEHTH